MLNLSDCNEIEQTSSNEMIRTTILTDGKTLSSFGKQLSVVHHLNGAFRTLHLCVPAVFSTI